MLGKLGSRVASRRVALPLLLVAVIAAGCAAPPPVGKFADLKYEVDRTDDIRFAQVTDEHGLPETLRLDMFRPAGAEGPRPAIVFIHSGAFTGGFRMEQDEFAAEFAARGYVTVTIDYRLKEGQWIWFNTPSDIVQTAARDARHDAQAAVRFLRAHADEYGIDAGHIGAVGYSAGAITAIGMAQHAADPGDSGWAGESSKICVAVSISGISVEGDIQPVGAPILMFHGGTDFIIPVSYARETGWQAIRAKKLVQFVEFPGIGHTVPQQKKAEIMPTMVRTLRDYLVDGPPCA